MVFTHLPYGHPTRHPPHVTDRGLPPLTPDSRHVDGARRCLTCLYRRAGHALAAQGQGVGRTTSNMPIKVGEVEALFRYPVKSMSGELLEVADLGWHGLDGDRRLAFRRADDRAGFP